MASGGARNRSGPLPDPKSGRSDARGYKLNALPAAGHDGEVPEFPLQKVLVYEIYFVDKERMKELDEAATESRREREIDLWNWAWSTPQACAWSMDEWRWHTVAMWVRTAVICESADATAADKNSLHRFADQIGFTPAGLRENGWRIADGKSAEGDAGSASESDPPPSNVTDIKSRLANGGA